LHTNEVKGHIPVFILEEKEVSLVTPKVSRSTN